MNFGQQSSRASRREEIMRARKYEKLMWQIMDNLKQNYDINTNDRNVQTTITSIIEQTGPQMQGMPIPEQINRLTSYCEGELQNQNLMSRKQTMQENYNQLLALNHLNMFCLSQILNVHLSPKFLG